MLPKYSKSRRLGLGSEQCLEQWLKLGSPRLGDELIKSVGGLWTTQVTAGAQSPEVSSSPELLQLHPSFGAFDVLWLLKLGE